MHPLPARQLALLAVGALVASLAQGCSAGSTVDGQPSSTGTPATTSPAPVLPTSDEQVEFQAAANALTRVVVSVEIEQRFSTGRGGTQLIPTGNGSGVIVRQDGYIVTNYHVVKGADRLDVDLGAQHLPAQVVGTDPSTDLAVIRIGRTGLPAARIGSSHRLGLGEWVLAVGSPFGFSHSVSAGIVSALGRSLLSPAPTSTAAAYTDLIQTDASINPGNSGGALGTLDGQVVGINSLVESQSGDSSGVGFAIPIDFAMNIADQIIRTGHAVHPFIGANVTDMDAHIALEMGLSTNVEKGAIVQEVLPGSPSASAGMQPGDIVTSLGGRPVSDGGSYWAALRAQSIGSTARVVVNRGGKDLMLQVRIGSGRTG